MGVALDGMTVTGPNGDVVTLLRFRRGATRFVLHAGSTDPPAYPGEVPAAAGSVVTSAERPVLLAAFNGGFKANAGAGGFEAGGAVLRPLLAGYASLVIYADGSAVVGPWGLGVPAQGEVVVSVRQNLQPLVFNGRASPLVGYVPDWGATLGGRSSIARSSLGEDAYGNLIYAGSSRCLPSDLASALITAGTVSAMELDINPEWVQADVAAAPGGPLVAQIADQTRPAGQYLYGWTRDFVTVLARS
jgi:hypothetical protein